MAAMTDARAVEVLAAMREDGGVVADADYTAAIDRAIARLREPVGVGWTHDAENWGNALNDAAWKFTEHCPEKSALLFNNTKAPLRMAILHYAEKVMEAAPQPPDEVQRCTCPSGDGSLRWPCPAHPPMQQGGGEVPEAELIALVAGPYNWHHKMNEMQEREAKAFDRCRELTIQNIRTWCATRRAMRAAAPPSAPVGVEKLAAQHGFESVPLDGEPRWEFSHSGLLAFAAALAQQPAQSAPVGVEAICESLVQDWQAQGRMPQMAWDFRGFAADAIRRMIAQQPAAVDGAMAGWIADGDTIPDYLIEATRGAIRQEFGNNGTDGYYRRILVRVFRALAAQPGGSDNDR